MPARKPVREGPRHTSGPFSRWTLLLGFCVQSKTRCTPSREVRTLPWSKLHSGFLSVFSLRGGLGRTCLPPTPIWGPPRRASTQ
jgi:hypothetical protein